MRLDLFLFKKGFFESRMKAKEAIKRGFVKVNGNIIKKPSYEVRGDERIEIIEDIKPKGYYKIKELDEEWNFIKTGSQILDLGSSAGGFIIYALEKNGKVIGIEISKDFEDKLREIERENENVKIYIENVFNFNVELPELDVILCDLTLEPEISFRALEKFIPMLKSDGKILFISKGKEFSFPKNVKVLKSKKGEKEYYYLLKKIY